jgi:dUTP pyrophosphatase
MSLTINIVKIHPGAILPEYMSTGASGSDVSACLEAPLTIQPLERVAVSTGLKMEIPFDFEVQVRPRSGLSFKKGLTVVNAPGTIDSDYRGEVKILLVNLGKEAVVVAHGDRIAQFVVQRVERADWTLVDEVSDTVRAEGGFGSTGISSQPSANS